MTGFYLPAEAMHRGELLTAQLEAIAGVTANACNPKADTVPGHIADLMWMAHDLAKELHGIVTLRREVTP